MTQTNQVPSWRPSPRHAALLAQPAPMLEAPAQRTWTPEWGYGARGVNRRWTPPQARPVPTDWWKQ